MILHYLESTLIKKKIYCNYKSFEYTLNIINQMFKTRFGKIFVDVIAAVVD